ncbi:MAG: OmpA/MotB family protein [Gammaproteobacteria bacterium]
MGTTEIPIEYNPTIPPDYEDFGVDPWDNCASGQTDTDNWLLSYVDMLTLMLTLLVMLLAFNHIENNHPEFTPIDNVPEPFVKKQRAAESGHDVPAPVSRNLDTPAANDETYPTPLFMPLIDPSEGAKESWSEIFPEFEATGEQADADIPADPKPELPEKIARPFDSLETAEQPVVASTPAHTPPALTKSAPDSKIPDKEENPELDRAAVFRQMIAQQNLDGLIEVSMTSNAVRMEVNERILFKTGDANLKADGKALLDQLVEVFQKQPGNIHIEGHTDNIPIGTARFPSNWELSASRASSVARYLIDHSIAPERLRAVGFADTKPRAGNQDAAGRAKNRRVSLVVEIDDSKHEDGR